MPVKPYKRGFRALGVAECFKKRHAWSVVAGVVVRRDLLVDGVYVARVRVGGLDATERIVGMILKSGRKDINVVLLNGCVISWFNIVDPNLVFSETGIPVVCVTYEESEGLEQYIREYFPGDEERLRAYKRLGKRRRIFIRKARRYLYVRVAGIGEEEARSVLEAFAVTGGVPEPIRVARMIARSVHSFLVEEEPGFLGAST